MSTMIKCQQALKASAVVKARLGGSSDKRILNYGKDRVLGAYYTDEIPAKIMAEWCIRNDSEAILEPCFGDGVFIRAINEKLRARGFLKSRVYGCELVEEAYSGVVSKSNMLDCRRSWNCDFFELPRRAFHAIIGNPPYVRLRHLAKTQRLMAMQAAESVLGKQMDPSGSAWMPFVLRSASLLERGGRLAFVLPYDMTYVKYARPLWEYLGQSFGSIRVVRSYRRLFPSILQDVVVLLADDYGGATNHISYEVIRGPEDFSPCVSRSSELVSINQVVLGEKEFKRALVSAGVRSILSDLEEKSVPVGALCNFGIGYVAGDKDFFHPSSEIQQQMGLDPQSLIPAVTSSRQMSSAGLYSSALLNADCPKLFMPDASNLSAGDKKYISKGESKGVNDRYKCRIRDIWFQVPYVRSPDFLLGVFASSPTLMINNGNLVASNSLLCGELKKCSASRFASGWYTSLTLLRCEIGVHSLGGGVLVFVPGEMNNLLIKVPQRASQRQLSRVNSLLCSGRVASAYESGDKYVLQNDLGLTANDVEEIRLASDQLRSWREGRRGICASGELYDD